MLLLRNSSGHQVAVLKPHLLRLAELASTSIGDSIKQAVDANTVTASEALAARTFNTMLSSAIRAAGSPGDPAHAFAGAFLGELLQQSGLPTTPDNALVTQLAFDDEGNLMPGIVDANATPEQQQAQLAAHLTPRAWSLHTLSSSPSRPWCGTSCRISSGRSSPIRA